MCNFWLVEALTRAGKTDPARLAEARLRFEQMLGYGGPLRLFGEQAGASGEALGNLPRGFTHPGLISAALDRALDARGRPSVPFTGGLRLTTAHSRKRPRPNRSRASGHTAATSPKPGGRYGS